MAHLGVPRQDAVQRWSIQSRIHRRVPTANKAIAALEARARKTGNGGVLVNRMDARIKRYKRLVATAPKVMTPERGKGKWRWKEAYQGVIMRRPDRISYAEQKKWRRQHDPVYQEHNKQIEHKRQPAKNARSRYARKKRGGS